jgi:hypothetical protein
MDSEKKITSIVGVLFIAELVLYSIGSMLTEGGLNAPDYLVQLAAQKNQIITGALLETITAICLVFIGVLMYPVLKKQSATIARGYFGIRIIETVMTAGYAMIHLSILAISQEYVTVGAPDASYFHTIGALLKAGLTFTYQVHILFYGVGCVLVFGTLFQAKYVPRFISVLGLMTTILMLTGLVCDMYGVGVGMEIYGSPIGVCQILLGIWLIVKGFNLPAISSEIA